MKQAAFSERSAVLKRRFQPDVSGWCTLTFYWGVGGRPTSGLHSPGRSEQPKFLCSDVLPTPFIASACPPAHLSYCGKCWHRCTNRSYPRFSVTAYRYALARSCRLCRLIEWAHRPSARGSGLCGHTVGCRQCRLRFSGHRLGRR